MPRAFVYSLLGVNVILALAGAVYAARQGFPALTAAPIIAAFLLQISFYLLTGLPDARHRLERLAPARLGLLIFAAALTPYLIYSVPTGVFDFPALLKLAAVSAVPAFLFVVWPTKSARLTVQDVLVLAAIAWAELGKIFRQVYLSPIPDLRIECRAVFVVDRSGVIRYAEYVPEVANQPNYDAVLASAKQHAG